LYRLNFATPLKKGETLRVEFQVEADDPQHTARRHLGMFANDRLKGRVVMRVIFPAGLNANPHKQILPHLGAAETESREPLELDEFTREARWDVEKIRLFKVYQICW